MFSLTDQGWQEVASLHDNQHKTLPLDFSKESKNCEKLVEKRGGWGFEGDELQQSCSYLSTLQPSEECEKIREKVEEAHECMAV